MPCKHLRQLYEICRTHNLRLSSTDLIRIVCPTCGVEDVCPSVLCEEYESRHVQQDGADPSESGGMGVRPVGRPEP
jgi:hypothetical protein